MFVYVCYGAIIFYVLENCWVAQVGETNVPHINLGG